MNQKIFFKAFATIFLISIGGIIALNYYFDYYGVLRETPVVLKASQFNERFIKMKYLLQDRGMYKYDSYLWGSSRVQKMDTKVTGLKTYNMGAAKGMPEDCLSQLQILVQNGAKIHCVYLGLDDFSYIADYSSEIMAIHRRPYSQNKLENWSYYGRLLIQVPTVRMGIKDRLHNLQGKEDDKGIERILETGTFFVPESIERDIEQDPKKYVTETKFQALTKNSNGGENRYNQCLNEIEKIHRLCQKNRIDFVPFFNPVHMTNYVADDLELMNRFKKDLVKISPFWDFSGVNYVTANNYFWYETSHPRAFICDKILDTVSGQHKITWVPDFGVYVTPENVDAFCEKAVRDREAYDPNHEQWVPSAEERAVMTKRMNYPW